MFRYLGLMDPRIDDPFGTLEIFDQDPETLKKMLACCMEYIYLGTCDDSAFDGYDGLLDRFMVGGHDEFVIRDKIVQLYRCRGVRGFYSKYYSQEFEESRTYFTAEFEKNED